MSSISWRGKRQRRTTTRATASTSCESRAAAASGRGSNKSLECIEPPVEEAGRMPPFLPLTTAALQPNTRGRQSRPTADSDDVHGRFIDAVEPKVRLNGVLRQRHRGE